MDEALRFLSEEIAKREKRTVVSFPDYLDLIHKEPQRMLRNIFQIFYDLVQSHVIKGEDEHPDDPESIGFVEYDCSQLFVKGADNPFFVDRLFANRFIQRVESLRQGVQQNKIYSYEGPSGCGKSTFLNNLLRAFEAYTDTGEGRSFEMFWEIDEARLTTPDQTVASKIITVPCPSHDYPILIIPKKYRVGFLERLLADSPEIKKQIFTEKPYEWIFRGDVCTICKAIFRSLIDKHLSLERILNMIKVRPIKFDRHMGEGISIFNPGDPPAWGVIDGKPLGGHFSNKEVQESLDRMFGAHAVRYVFSPLARTNNGVYVLMDVKGHNQHRLLDLHNVISEGVHKVDGIEEPVNSLFFALMNPEDNKVIEQENMESLKGRIKYNKIPFVLEPQTEMKIYRSIFGERVGDAFLPRVLENFARVIIGSRMDPECPELKEWIPNVEKYKRYCDEGGLLLRMEIYSGVIPDWLSEEDKRKFTAMVRRSLIRKGEVEGAKGFSGRDSLQMFGEFVQRYGGRQSLINILNLADYFKHKIGREVRNTYIPPKFLASLVDSYDYTVLGEVKESLYFYNQTRIEEDILHFLWAISYDVGDKGTCRETGKEVEVTMDFLKLVVSRLVGKEVDSEAVLQFGRDMQKRSLSERMRQENGVRATEIYKELIALYRRNVKEKVLQPFVKNENFRESVKAYGTAEFDTFDSRLREHVVHLVTNLIGRLCYTEQGAKEITLYVLDKDLVEKFS